MSAVEPLTSDQVAVADGAGDDRRRRHVVPEAGHAPEDAPVGLLLRGDVARAERVVDVVDAHVLGGHPAEPGTVHDRPPDRDVRAEDVEAVDEHAGGPEVRGPVRLPAAEVADPERVARLGHGLGRLAGQGLVLAVEVEPPVRARHAPQVQAEELHRVGLVVLEPDERQDAGVLRLQRAVGLADRPDRVVVRRSSCVSNR